MKQVLVLGAGLVARPLVQYLLDADYGVTVATRTVSKAEALVGDHPNGKALPLLIYERDQLTRLIEAADVVISLVPPPYHPDVATICLDTGTDLITTSYIGAPMQAFDEAAKAKGLLFLNEIGLDPGIDHMSAMKVIDEVEADGGKVTGFFSACGALPAPEAAQTPWSYKFSWSPIGVVRAVRNDGRFLEDGEAVDVPSENLFKVVKTKDIPELGTMEVYTNRDCLGYIDLYKVQGVTDMFRGTFRYPSHCAAWTKIVELGLTDEETTFDLPDGTMRQLIAAVAGVPADEGLEQALADRFGIGVDDNFFDRLNHIRLLGDDPLPANPVSPMTVLVHQMEEYMTLGEDERDMVLLYDEFDVEFDDGRKELHRSVLLDFGIPHGDSATARTVSLPAAVATHMLLEGKITATGVHAPTIPEIYGPVLDGLAELGITLQEQVVPQE